MDRLNSPGVHSGEGLAPFEDGAGPPARSGVTGRGVDELLGIGEQGADSIASRMSEDFRLGVMLVCGGLSAAVMSGFSVYRFWTGDWLVATLHLSLATVMVAAIIVAARTGRNALCGLVMAAVNTAWCILLASVIGVSGLFAAFNVVVLNFMLTPTLVAAVSSVFLIIAMALLPLEGLDLVQRLGFCAGCGLVAVNAWIFAARSNRQASRLEQLAARDPLTGAGNRRLLSRDLDHAIQQARIWNLRPALAVMDLDHFKRINDDYGHAAGDRTLVSFTTLLRAGLRHTDRVYRVGGEEFVLLVSDSTDSGLRIILDQVQRLVRSELRCQESAVTVSIGAAILNATETAGQVLQRADRALYEAKRRGRNCTVFADSAEPEEASPAPRREPASALSIGLVRYAAGADAHVGRPARRS